MGSENAGHAPLRLLIGGACLVVILAGLKAASSLLVLIAFSAFLAILATPLVNWLRRRRVPDVLAVGLVMLLVLMFLSGLAGVVGGSLNSLVAEMPRYQERFNALVTSVTSVLEDRGVEVSASRVRGLMDLSATIGFVGGTVAQLASVLSDTFLVFLTVVFLLFEGVVLPAKLRAALGEASSDLGRYSKIITEIHQYVVIKTYISLAAGVLVWLMLWMLGVDFALLWGLITFLLHFIPNIGAIVAGVPPVLLALIQYGLGRAMVVLVGFTVICMIFGNIVEPRVMGRRLGLSTLVVFLSLLVWGWLWGGMGMLLSVPLTMILKIVLENSHEWHWIAALMDDAVPPEPLSRRSIPGAPVLPTRPLD
ncbi:AI-2E family transporter [Chondromyces crocatus]|nr:AI-2E family transporter [Chondromyces crocatus]